MAIYPKGKTESDIEKVYKDAYKMTKIIYPKKIGWFSPKLKNLNHIKADRSGIRKNIFIRILDALIILYYKFKEWIKSLILAIYPRRNKLYGKAKDTYLSGKITFAKKQDSMIPIHNVQVNFWARKRFGAWRKLSDGYTDNEGQFKLEFDYLESRKWKYKKFYFEIYQNTHIFFNQESGDSKLKNAVFERILVKKSDLTGMGFSLGTIPLFYWEYRSDTPLPRTVIKDHDRDAPEFYSDERNEAIEAQFVPIQLIKDKHLVIIDLDPNSLSIETIQRDYPKNLTVAMEEILPYSTRCDYWFGRRMMNGMNCATFQPDPDKPGYYWVKYFGACNYKVNDEYAFPTVETQFRLAENGLPLPTKIVVSGPTNQYDKDPFQVKEFRPEDGDMWEHAKRVARVTGALSTELDDHFAGTHLNTEQYAIAARRNLRKNPISELLLPHLKEVALINHSADTLLIGPGYIPRASALTETAIIERAKDLMGVLDWKNWKPMEPISDQHTYAIAENLFWEVVGDFIDFFFDKNKEMIEKEWYEIFCFSQDLIDHSVAPFLSGTDSGNLSENEKKLNADRLNYYHERYRFDKNLTRVDSHGEKKCISSITSHKYAPADGDMDNLKAACRYAIMMATFMHTYVNEHQYEDIGEVFYNSLGLRYGSSENGIFMPEDDHSIAPDPTRATQMMWFSNLLSRTEYGFITRNKEHDIHPYFCKILKDKKEEFAALNVEVDNIESRTNI